MTQQVVIDEIRRLRSRIIELESAHDHSVRLGLAEKGRAIAAEAEVHRLNHENGALEEEARALREALGDQCNHALIAGTTRCIKCGAAT